MHRGPYIRPDKGLDVKVEVQRVMQLAGNATNAIQVDYIYPVHILRELLRVNEGRARLILRNLKIDTKEMRKKVDEETHPLDPPYYGPNWKHRSRDPHFSGSATGMIKSAFEYAERCKSRALGTEHILYAMVGREGYNSSTAYAKEILESFGLTPDLIDEEIQRTAEQDETNDKIKWQTENRSKEIGYIARIEVSKTVWSGRPVILRVRDNYHIDLAVFENDTQRFFRGIKASIKKANPDHYCDQRVIVDFQKGMNEPEERTPSPVELEDRVLEFRPLIISQTDLNRALQDIIDETAVPYHGDVYSGSQFPSVKE